MRWSRIASEIGAPNWVVGLAVSFIMMLLVCGVLSASLDASGAVRIQSFYQLALVLAGLFALPLAIWRSYTAHRQAVISAGQLEGLSKQIAISEIGAESDRLEKAAGLLASDAMSVRIAGVAILARLARKDGGIFSGEARYNLIAFVEDRSLLEEEKRASAKSYSYLQDKEKDTPLDMLQAFIYLIALDGLTRFGFNSVINMRGAIISSFKFVQDDGFMVAFHECKFHRGFVSRVFRSRFSRCEFIRVQIDIERSFRTHECSFDRCKLSGTIKKEHFDKLDMKDCEYSDLELID